MAVTIYRRALKETAAALRLDKPMLAVVVAAITFAVVWKLTGQPAWGGVAAFGASVALFVPVYFLKLMKLAGEADVRSAHLERQLADRRDPDTLYQLGRAVALGPQAAIHLAQSVVVFPHVTDEGEFNPAAEFDYRDYTLEVAEADVAVAAGMGGRRFVNRGRIVARIKEARS